MRKGIRKFKSKQKLINSLKSVYAVQQKEIESLNDKMEGVFGFIKDCYRSPDEIDVDNIPRDLLFFLRDNLGVEPRIMHRGPTTVQSPFEYVSRRREMMYEDRFYKFEFGCR
jgi:hypothetical protein